MRNKRGLEPIVLFVVVIAIVIVGGGIYYTTNNGDLLFSPRTSSVSDCVDSLDRIIKEESLPTDRDISNVQKCSNREIESYALSLEGAGSCDEAMAADINEDGVVDVSDLIAVLFAWETSDFDSDINEDGVVDVSDLIAVLFNWGPVQILDDIGNLNEDCHINFLDLAIVQDEWGTSGEIADLNNDGIVDNNDLIMLRDRWDEVEGSGQCDDKSIPNTIGGCTQVLCSGGGHQGLSIPEKDQTTYVPVRRGDKLDVIELDNLGSFLTIFDPFDNSLTIIDPVLNTEISFSLGSGVEEKKHGINILQDNNKNDNYYQNLGTEIIEITYDKQTDIGGGGGGINSQVRANLFCYDLDKMGQPKISSGTLIAAIVWQQEPGEINTEQMIVSQDYINFDKCNIRLHDINYNSEADTLNKLFLMDDVSEEVFFTDVNLNQNQIVEAMEESIPEYESLSGVKLNTEDYSFGVSDPICGADIEVNLFNNNHPDLEDTSMYGFFTRIDEIRFSYSNIEYFIAEGRRGYPFTEQSEVEKSFELYNPTRNGVPSRMALMFFVESSEFFLGGLGFDVISYDTYFPIPLARSARITMYNGLEYSNNYYLTGWPRLYFSGENNDYEASFHGVPGQIVPEETAFLQYFEDLVRDQIIDNFGGFFGFFEDVSTEWPVVIDVADFNNPIIIFGEISTKNPDGGTVTGTGLNKLYCNQHVGLSNPSVNSCINGIYALDYDYSEELKFNIEGRDCVMNEDGVLEIIDCPT
jgi:hypothetical protein